MPTIIDLAQKVKAKYPGQYDDLSDIDLGNKIKAKYPSDYNDFEDVSNAPQRTLVQKAIEGGRNLLLGSESALTKHILAPAVGVLPISPEAKARMQVLQHEPDLHLATDAIQELLPWLKSTPEERITELNPNAGRRMVEYPPGSEIGMNKEQLARRLLYEPEGHAPITNTQGREIPSYQIPGNLGSGHESLGTVGRVLASMGINTLFDPLAYLGILPETPAGKLLKTANEIK